ncbi:MAG: PilZ domain-containing protein [Terriglobia bacterium]
MEVNTDQQSAPSHRAGRYPVRTAIRFRVRGEDEWREGVTEDISRTGVFLRSSFLPDIGAKVEMVLSLPAGVWGKSPGEVLGQGQVVRLTRSLSLGQQAGMATTIDRYRMARKDTILPGILRKP